MISALLEARSCERFAVLADRCPDGEIANLYRGLYSSEAGHYRVFIGLAEAWPCADRVAARWDEMLHAEAEIIASQPPGPRMHSGVA